MFKAWTHLQENLLTSSGADQHVVCVTGWKTKNEKAQEF